MFTLDDQDHHQNVVLFGRKQFYFLAFAYFNISAFYMYNSKLKLSMLNLYGYSDKKYINSISKKSV